MKIKLDYGYMKKIKYITLGFVIIYVIYLVITDMSDVYKGLSSTFSIIVKTLSPFLWGLVIAYLLNPLVRYFERIIGKIRIGKRWSRNHPKQRRAIIRGLSLILTLAFIIAILVLLFNSIFVMINGSFEKFEFTVFIEEITTRFADYSKELEGLEEKLEMMGFTANLSQAIKNLSGDLVTGIQTILGSLTNRITTIGRYIIDISFGFVFAFNFIMNREYFNGLVENALRLLFNNKKKNSLKEVAGEINVVFLSFIRGKIIDLTILSLVTVISLVIIGFKYAFIVGTFAGYTNIIPYLGTWVGIIPAVIIALVSGTWQQAVFVGLYIVVIQQIYYIIVSPRIQGKSVGMHPVFILLAMFVFTKFFGLVGMVLSIPMGGIVKIFINRWVKKRQERKNIKLIQLEKT